MKVFWIDTAVIAGIALVVLAAAHVRKVCRAATEFLDHY